MIKFKIKTRSLSTAMELIKEIKKVHPDAEIIVEIKAKRKTNTFDCVFEGYGGGSYILTPSIPRPPQK